MTITKVLLIAAGVGAVCVVGYVAFKRTSSKRVGDVSSDIMTNSSSQYRAENNPSTFSRIVENHISNRTRRNSVANATPEYRL